MEDLCLSDAHTDPKQLRKLKQQQLQQKFRQEMEAKKLLQGQGQTLLQLKTEGPDTAIAQAPSEAHGKTISKQENTIFWRTGA